MERVPSQDLRAAEGMSAFFIIPRAGQEVADEPVRRPPAARAAPGGAGAAGVPAAGRRRRAVGLRDILTGRHEVKGPAPDRLFAISTAYVTLQTEHQIDPGGRAAIVFQALATSEFEATLKEMEEVVTATGGESGTTRLHRGRQLRLPLDDAAQPRRRAERRRPRGRASTPCRARSRRPATASGCCARCSPSRTRRSDADLLHLQLQARLLVPVRARPARVRRRSARPSASCRSRRRCGSELPIEPELERWFPLWGIPI